MKLKARQEIKNKPQAELSRDLLKCREDLQKLKFDLAAGKSKNIKGIRSTKKQIAIILTAINSNKNK